MKKLKPWEQRIRYTVPYLYRDSADKMPGSTNSSRGSGASTPEQLFSGNESSALGTPLTERSLLFHKVDIDFAVRNAINDQWILVVGGLGFIGSHTVWELAKAGYNVMISLPTFSVIANKPAGGSSRQPQQFIPHRLRKTPIDGQAALYYSGQKWTPTTTQISRRGLQKHQQNDGDTRRI